MNLEKHAGVWADRRKWFVYFAALLILFSAVNYTALLGDSVYARNNGPTFLADRVYPFVILPVYLEAPFYLISIRLKPLLHLRSFTDFTDPENDVVFIVFISSLTAAFYGALGVWLRKLPFLKRVQARLPRWLPGVMYLIIALFFSGLAVYLTVSMHNYVPPPIPD